MALWPMTAVPFSLVFFQLVDSLWHTESFFEKSLILVSETVAIPPGTLLYKMD